MLFIRPAPPTTVQSAWSSLAGQLINDHKPIAGSGVNVKHGPNGTIISLDDDLDPVNFTYAGNYSFSSSYNPGDVVFVDPNASYYDWTGQPIPVCTGTSSTHLPAICGGLFVCTRFVPPYGYDQGMLTSSVVLAYANSDQTISTDFADTFRWYAYDVYWPIYPLIPQGSITMVTGSGLTIPITANINYWAPLSPMIAIPISNCANGNMTSSITYLNGVVSGSTFAMSTLPYQS